MFLSLAHLFGSDDKVFEVHPLQLSRWLEEAWQGARQAPIAALVSSPGDRSTFLGDDGIVDRLGMPMPPASLPIAPSGIDIDDTETYTDDIGPGSIHKGTHVGLLWHHLIYAYLIEATGILEVCGEVLRRLVVGETLESVSLPAAEWARTTEELFFRDPPLYAITGVVSELRPSSRVNRRNAYWRMFNLDLPHPVPARPSPATGAGGQPWKLDTGSVNTGFREKWSELLRQVWLGIENSRNLIGSNATDAEYIALLCRAIKDMLNGRRRRGLLARDEFVYVTAMSWFHLTVRGNSEIVMELKCDATSPADRLEKLAARVGMSAAPTSRELFELAEPMSTLLRGIELGLFDTAGRARTLFDGDTPLRRDMNLIIDLWQSATGERVKDRPSTNVLPGPAAQPVRIPTPGPARALPAVSAGPAASNGHLSGSSEWR
ncbi:MULTISPECIES: hypothetical protein [unclassified Pseudofrankia]|uniref:hypothetical protein n=1 Tax=unclassified Pseudofrankia TaxID=2994372 RepID=UPI0008D8F9D6|nr:MULTISPECIES: hypothetical protein [unclassified Pseudofrankia]MDT3439333.1 hypothetical protein [Pseudofrankia sp. BMG5.37]OHV73953.1 hypothetical protein BCD48_32955 [Pseudofrankia sp. BMG5.36]